MRSKPLDIVKNKKLEQDFEPSMKTLSSMLEIMLCNNSEGKTSLSVDTHLNYTRLAKHIVWLEKKGFVESEIDTSEIKVVLTTKGKAFASTISDCQDT